MMCKCKLPTLLRTCSTRLEIKKELFEMAVTGIRKDECVVAGIII
jgi:hypothetical protein